MRSKTIRSVIRVVCFCLCVCLPTGCRSIVNDANPLETLKLIDDYPLYTMHYVGEYSQTSFLETDGLANKMVGLPQSRSISACLTWGCSLFAAFGDSDNVLYGRNFDWHFSPAILLFVNPAQGYDSVSMVDIAYLGFDGQRAKNLMELSQRELNPLLNAPSLPFDGMNEKGLAIGMASVPAGNVPIDPQKPTIDSLLVMREILDKAATVDEAVSILGRYNVDMGSVPLHYLIADRSGKAALVEYYSGETIITYNEKPWHLATNFIVASTNRANQGRCHRYDTITSVLVDNQGKLTSTQAISLLEDVASDDAEYGTQWSIVYDISNTRLWVVMGRNYEKIYPFRLSEP